MDRVWFDTGLKNNDGSPKTVSAIDAVQIAECEKKGWVRVKEAKKESKKKEG